jgi:hypothetical protein
MGTSDEKVEGMVNRTELLHDQPTAFVTVDFVAGGSPIRKRVEGLFPFFQRILSV